jgi:hypothetical protein
MSETLVVALAIGFVPGGKDVMEVRPTNRWLLVGTWERRTTDGRVETWNFRRNGQVTHTFQDPEDGWVQWSGVYNSQGQRLRIQWCGPGIPEEILHMWQLDGRVLVVGMEGTLRMERFRRR